MDDLLGWQATRWGMTSEEIIAAVGADTLLRMDRQKYQGSYAELTIPNVKIESFSYDVIFQMSEESDRLHQVLIKHEELDFADPQKPFEAARRMLTERFGQPTRVGTTNEWCWTFKTTHIYLSKTHIPDIMSHVYIRFRPANRPDQRTIPAF